MPLTFAYETHQGLITNSFFLYLVHGKSSHMGFKEVNIIPRVPRSHLRMRKTYKQGAFYLHFCLKLPKCFTHDDKFSLILILLWKSRLESQGLNNLAKLCSRYRNRTQTSWVKILYFSLKSIFAWILAYKALSSYLSIESNETLEIIAYWFNLNVKGTAGRENSPSVIGRAISFPL